MSLDIIGSTSLGLKLSFQAKLCLARCAYPFA